MNGKKQGVVAAVLLVIAVGAVQGAIGSKASTTRSPVAQTSIVAQVPTSCLAALDDADQIAKVTADLAVLFQQQIALQGDIMDVQSAGDASRVDEFVARQDQITKGIDGLKATVLASRYAADRDACKAVSDVVQREVPRSLPGV